MIDLPGGEVLEDQQPYEALYIHIPFCKSKCAYCDFASEAISADDPRIEAYIDEPVSYTHLDVYKRQVSIQKCAVRRLLFQTSLSWVKHTLRWFVHDRALTRCV